MPGTYITGGLVKMWRINDIDETVGSIRVVRYGSIVYIYLGDMMNPLFTRTFSDEKDARTHFIRFVTALRKIKRMSLIDRIREWWWKKVS
jgi:hypothetical protein